ncbi:hypothetical protein N658DRAFT_445005, partial [Parathielavia hyrcaniae]
MLADVGETRQNIKELKGVIQHQTDMLVKLTTELISVKTELATVKTELSNVKKQVAEDLNPNPSYANVARTPPTNSPNLNSI